MVNVHPVKQDPSQREKIKGRLKDSTPVSNIQSVPIGFRILSSECLIHETGLKRKEMIDTITTFLFQESNLIPFFKTKSIDYANIFYFTFFFLQNSCRIADLQTVTVFPTH